MFDDKEEIHEWFCQHCGEKNGGDALICESCGEELEFDSYTASTMNSRKYEHEEFRKRFWKFKEQYPDIIKKFTRIIKDEIGMMLSPSGTLNIEDEEVPDVSAEEIIRMAMALGMSCDAVFDMMIEQSKNYD